MVWNGFIALILANDGVNVEKARLAAVGSGVAALPDVDVDFS